MKLDANWYEECTNRRGRKVQSQAILPDTPEGNVTYLGRSGSIGFGFDAADWAGYTSQGLPDASQRLARDCGARPAALHPLRHDDAAVLRRPPTGSTT